MILTCFYFGKNEIKILIASKILKAVKVLILACLFSCEEFLNEIGNTGERNELWCNVTSYDLTTDQNVTTHGNVLSCTTFHTPSILITTPINMNEEEEKKMLKMVKQMKAIPMPIYEGMALPTFPPIREKGVERVIDDIMNLQTRETDILICTLGKSGTHWTYEIIKMLLNNTTELDKSEKAHTMLEAILDLSIMDALPSPRVLNTHLKFKYIPKKFIEDKGKIVHMIRNPKDVCVSSYYHAMKDIFTLIEGTFGEFYDKWLSGEGFPYGSWFDYELAMEQAEKDHPGMIYTIQYEQMKKEPEKEIRKLAEFLGAKCSDQIITGIAKATLFENMKQNKADTSTKMTKDGSSYIYRKGQIGDWKNHFTVAQNEQFDAIFKEKMKNSSYDLVFE